MNARELSQALGWELAQPAGADREIRAAYTSDLLSDVMAHAPEDSVLVTIQAHLNTVAVATLAGVRAIAICHHRPLPADMLAAAAREQIAILRTRENQFDASWRLHEKLEAAP